MDKYEKSKKSCLAFFHNAQRDVVGFFITDHFIIAFEKKDKAYFFPHVQTFHHEYLSQLKKKLS